MNWLGRIGVTMFLLGWLCLSGLSIASDSVFKILLVGFFIGVPVGFVLMLISALYDRYKQLKTEQIHPKV